MKKATLFLLAVVLAATCLACSHGGQGESTASSNEQSVTQNPVGTDISTDDTTAIKAPQIPENVKGNGTKFVVYTQGWWGYTPLDVTDWGVESYNSEGVNDASYNRERTLEELLDIKIEVRAKPECYDSINELRIAVDSGESDVDLALLRSAVFTTAISSRIISDLDSNDLAHRGRPSRCSTDKELVIQRCAEDSQKQRRCRRDVAFLLLIVFGIRNNSEIGIGVSHLRRVIHPTKSEQRSAIDSAYCHK